MHCITPHASLPNRSIRPRRTLIYEYRANDAFPIYYGEMTNLAEAKFRLVRGKPARFARFGGPRPMIPHVGKYTSLYELQSEAKAQRKKITAQHLWCLDFCRLYAKDHRQHHLPWTKSK